MTSLSVYVLIQPDDEKNLTKRKQHSNNHENLPIPLT